MINNEADVTEGELWHVLTELLRQASVPAERVWWLTVAVRAVDKEFLSTERTRGEPAESAVPPVSEAAKVTLEKIFKPTETLEEAQNRLGEAAKAQSDFLNQDNSIERAFARFSLEVDLWPEDEQAQIVEGARRDLERERQIHGQLAETNPENIECVAGKLGSDPDKAERWLADNAEAIEDANRYIDNRRHKIDQMQDRVDAARESPDDSRTKEDLVAGARQRKSDPEDRHLAAIDGIASVDRGEIVNQDDVERVLSTPMRIQDLLSGAQPQEWEIMQGGGFIATPTRDSTLLVGRRSSGIWQWSVHVNELGVSTVGTALDPARAVASAEAVYWLVTMGSRE